MTISKDKKIEYRAFPVAELRVLRDGDKPPILVGHAAVFNVLSEELFGFRERVLPGAFTKSLGDDIRALWNHDSSHVLGRTKNGSLSLVEDAVGLAITIRPPDTQMARDALVLIERGDVSQMSFGFRTISDRWHIEEAQEIRELVEVKLFDVSPVTFPAYPQTDVALRSLDAWRQAHPRMGRHPDVLRRRLALREKDLTRVNPVS